MISASILSSILYLWAEFSQLSSFTSHLNDLWQTNVYVITNRFFFSLTTPKHTFQMSKCNLYMTQNLFLKVMLKLQ